VNNRRSRPWLTLAYVLAATTAAVAPAQAAEQAHQAPTSTRGPVRLQTEGGYFRDAQGRVVILHGFNLNGTEFPNSDSAGPEGFTAKDADFLAANGFNFIRLGINWSQFVPERPMDPGHFTIDQTALDKVLRVADLLASDHIYYMLDFHQGCFQEWPDWAIPWDKGVGQSTAISAFPECYLVPNGVSRASDNLVKDPDPDNAALPGGSLATIPVSEVWADYREAWRQVAAQFRNRDYLMGYDFINEPGTSHFWECDIPALGCQHADEKIQAFEENALAGIREADPVSSTDPTEDARAGIGVFEPVSVEGTSGAPTGFGDIPVTDPKVAWSFHVYCGNFAEPVPGTHACADLMRPAFEGTAGVGGSTRNAAHLTGADTTVAGGPRVPGAQPAPQLMSEFGSTTDPNVIEDTLVSADPHFVSWAYWQYKNYPDWQIGIFSSQHDEQCVCFDDPSPRADVLIRPYPQATAGTPVSYSYDQASRTMAYTYTPADDRSSATQIVVPAYFAPHGYKVSVTHGHVVSAPGALDLEILPTSSRNVTVTIEPS